MHFLKLWQGLRQGEEGSEEKEMGEVRKEESLGNKVRHSIESSSTLLARSDVGDLRLLLLLLSFVNMSLSA